MEVKDYTNRTSTFWFFKGRHTSSNFPVSHSRSSQPNEKSEEAENIDVISVSDSVMKQRKPLGWRAMPFILGNETFERLGSWGIAANFQLYLMIKYNMTMYSVAMLAQWNSLNNFLTVVGAFVADAYTGKFPTIVFGSIATMLGMVMVTLTAVVPNLLPPQCTDIERHQGQCTGPNNAQLAFLYLALCLLAIGGGAIRPCSIPFAVDQFDSTTDRGRKDINSFFNWYYTSFTIILLITSTVVAYVQNHHWGWGFAIPTICMAFSLILLFVGTRIYIYVKPEGSVFSSIVQVPVAAYKKRSLQLPVDGIVDRVFYDPPRKKISIVSKLPLSSRFRERKWVSWMPYHAVLGFLIPLLLSVLQVTNQGTNKYSFETHTANLWTFLLATLVYCFAFAANIKSRLCNPNYTQLSSLVAVISGTLSSVCLLTLFLPSLPGCLIFILWACVSVVVSRNFIMIIYRWNYQMIMKTLFLVFGIWNRFKGRNLVEQPRSPV